MGTEFGNLDLSLLWALKYPGLAGAASSIVASRMVSDGKDAASPGAVLLPWEQVLTEVIGFVFTYMMQAIVLLVQSSSADNVLLVFCIFCAVASCWLIESRRMCSSIIAVLRFCAFASRWLQPGKEDSTFWNSQLSLFLYRYKFVEPTEMFQWLFLGVPKGRNLLFRCQSC